jgi:hypothetical protein
MAIKLIDVRDKNLVEDFALEAKPICICDFYIRDSQKGNASEDHLWYNHILNIDHHSPLPQFERLVSSTNMALSYVRKFGKIDMPIFINHTDCDSVLSSLIMNGELEPREEYGSAAIAADHTGQENEISDLLQALDPARDFSYSVRELHKLLNYQKYLYEPRTIDLLRKRQEERAEARKFAPLFKSRNGIYYLQLDSKVDSAFLPYELPEAKIILLGVPMSNGKLEVKVRLGMNSAGIKLNQLQLPDFGGRWNAGSTKRSGGTDLSLEQYLEVVMGRIN